MEISIEFPPAYKEAIEHILNRDRRHIWLEGGRAGGKTKNVCRALLITAMAQKTLICVGRELENTTKDSVHRAFLSNIEECGMTGWQHNSERFWFPDTKSEIIFKGLRTSQSSGARDAQRVKSLEGVDVFWFEEAQSASTESIDVLIPTIRAKGSMLIWTSNRLAKSDPARLRVAEPLIGTDNPASSRPIDDGRTFVQKIDSWDIENYLPKEVLDERAQLEVLDPANYRHVWRGEPLTEVNGGIFTRQLAEARNANRVGKYPYDNRYEVHPVFDLGVSDSTAIWLMQIRDGAVYFIDYLEDFGRPVANYFSDLRNLGYRFGTVYLPHDANNRSNRASDINQVQATSLLDDLKKMLQDFRFKVLPRNEGYGAIDLARGMFSTFYFDEERCKRGLECIGAYHYEWSEKNKILSKVPKHDWSSHGADAFQYAVMAIKDIRKNASLGGGESKLHTYVPSWGQKG